MALTILFAGRWVGRRMGVSCPPSRKLGAGAVAAGLVLAADLAVGVGLRGMSVVQVFSGRDPVAGFVYYALIVFAAIAPWLLTRPERRGAP